MGDILFDTVTRWSGERQWGRFLDAGTGAHSLKWICKGLETEGWDAITADEQMRQNVLKEKDVSLRAGKDRVLVGNWMDDAFCSQLDGDYDTILADYLIGAVDGFSPYTQDEVVARLRKHLKPGSGRLYVIGLAPIPDHAPGAADIVCEVRRARDACILLANHRPYREYPMDWMTRHLEKSGFKVMHTKKCTILHSEESILRQLRVGSSKLDLMPEGAREGMTTYLADLARRVKDACASTENGRISLSHDYIIEACCAEPGGITDEDSPQSVFPGMDNGDMEGQASS